MLQSNGRLTRRYFLATTAAAAGAAVLPFAPARAAAKYRRYNATSPQGQKALASYAKAIQAMLNLPADNPQNWFRNAFIHFMDCPHGNWWFYVWHRGYLGYFEQTIRTLSGDDSFAMPYWDWTALPQIPDGMFDGVLAPTDQAYEPYTGNLARFTSFIRPALTDYWNKLSSAQQAQLTARGYKTLDDVWNDMIGFVATPPGVISQNRAFASTCDARYLSRDNPKLDDKTAFNVTERILYAGLLPTDFYNPVVFLSFNSSKTTSHNAPPTSSDSFSTLEGLPHNKVHNYIGGVGAIDPGPYGNMTNNLSPVDPIFFLHHSNMDRLWDVWTRKQQAMHLPYLPTGDDLKTYTAEPFLFYVDGKGNYVGGQSKAGDYLSTTVFDYDYEPGSGEAIVPPPGAAAPLTAAAKAAPPPVKATVKANVATVAVPRAKVENYLADTVKRPLFAAITVARPEAGVGVFDVLVNAPADVTRVAADSPYYAGTISFFGSMPGMKMASDATFAVPLPDTLQALKSPGAANNVTLNIRLVPSHGQIANAPAIKAVSIGSL